MIVWKFVYSKGLKRNVLAKLEVPAGSLIFYNNGGKSRASQAWVRGFYDAKGNLLKIKRAYAPIHRSVKPFMYEVGNLVKPEQKFEVKPVQCASGIHFYMNRDDAVQNGRVR